MAPISGTRRRRRAARRRRSARAARRSGSARARIVPPTMLIGMSRSVSAQHLARRRARCEAAIAERMPPTIGPMILSRVQIAATPIVPAPMKRTWLRKTSVTVAATSAPDARRRRSAAAPAPPSEISMPIEHGDADGEADQMADADQRHRQAGRGAGRAPRRRGRRWRSLGGDQPHRRRAGRSRPRRASRR